MYRHVDSTGTCVLRVYFLCEKALLQHLPQRTRSASTLPTTFSPHTPQSQYHSSQNPFNISEWHNCTEQLRETSHLFESPPCSQSVQGNQEPQPRHDVEEPVTDDGGGRTGFGRPFNNFIKFLFRRGLTRSRPTRGKGPV